MSLIREFEERLKWLVETGVPVGPVHFYVGQEAIASGVCAALRAVGLDRVDAPRARALHRERRRRAADVGRALRQVDRDEPRQGWLDARDGHHRRRARREPDRRDGRHPRRRCRPVRRGPRRRRGRGGVLRRGSRGHRSGSRGDEHGRDLAAAGRVRLREQRVLSGDAGRVRARGTERGRPGRRLRHAGRRRGRSGRASPSTKRRA